MNSKEALERIKDDIEINYLSTKHSNEKDKDNYLSLLDIIEKDLEILEIIKTKRFDISLIKNCYGPLAYAVYNSHIDEEKNDKLTKQEYDLLKEWLEE